MKIITDGLFNQQSATVKLCEVWLTTLLSNRVPSYQPINKGAGTGCTQVVKMVDASPVNVLRWKIVWRTFNRASVLKCIDKIVPQGGLIKDLGENIDNIAESNR